MAAVAPVGVSRGGCFLASLAVGRVSGISHLWHLPNHRWELRAIQSAYRLGSAAEGVTSLADGARAYRNRVFYRHPPKKNGTRLVGESL